MSPPQPGQLRGLLRDVLVFQFKLMVDALRDLVMSPVAMAAALLDVLLSPRQSPRLFLATLQFGRRTEAWIDLWSSRLERQGPDAERIDALLQTIEQSVRDPHSGARRARVLKRWAEITLARKRREAERQIAARVQIGPQSERSDAAPVQDRTP